MLCLIILGSLLEFNTYTEKAVLLYMYAELLNLDVLLSSLPVDQVFLLQHTECKCNNCNQCNVMALQCLGYQSH